MTLIRAVDPKTGEPRLIIFSKQNGKEILKELSPVSYLPERMSAARLDTLADLSEISSARFGEKGRVNDAVGQELRYLNRVRPLPKTPTKRERRRQELRTMVGEAGLEAAREIGAQRGGRILNVTGGPPRTIRELTVPPVI